MYSHFDATSWVTPYGLIFLAAITVAWLFARRNAKSVGLDPSHIDLLMPIAISAGVVGGTVIALFVSMDDGIRVRLFAILGIGAAALFVYGRMAKLPFWRLLDVFALPTMAALAVHRIGCFLAGCCWGDVISQQHAMVQGVRYPPDSLAYEQHLAMELIEPGATASLPVYPVQLYEAGLVMFMLLLLSRVHWRRHVPGTIAILTVCSYALLRFFIEYLRADSYVVLANLTVTQLQCIILLPSILLLPHWRKSVVS